MCDYLMIAMVIIRLHGFSFSIYSLDDTLTLCNYAFLMAGIYKNHAKSTELLLRVLKANPHHIRFLRNRNTLFALLDIISTALLQHALAHTCDVEFYQALSFIPNRVR